MQALSTACVVTKSGCHNDDAIVAHCSEDFFHNLWDPVYFREEAAVFNRAHLILRWVSAADLGARSVGGRPDLLMDADR
jgi:hypothetical protein